MAKKTSRTQHHLSRKAVLSQGNRAVPSQSFWRRNLPRGTWPCGDVSSVSCDDIDSSSLSPYRTKDFCDRPTRPDQAAAVWHPPATYSAAAAAAWSLAANLLGTRRRRVRPGVGAVRESATETSAAAEALIVINNLVLTARWPSTRVDQSIHHRRADRLGGLTSPSTSNIATDQNKWRGHARRKTCQRHHVPVASLL